MEFANREEAGRRLAGLLNSFAGQRDLIVLGLPRGGVPVAAQVAMQLKAPLDVFMVRKLGLPGQPELAMGAIASGGVQVLNHELIKSLRVPQSQIRKVIASELRELQRRERAYRDDRPPPEVRDKVVIVVDDGVATGSTMIAAILALRQLGAGQIIVATPTISASTCDELRQYADDVVAVTAPLEFYGVGQFYADFSQTTDDEVRRLLALPGARPARAIA